VLIHCSAGIGMMSQFHFDKSLRSNRLFSFGRAGRTGTFLAIVFALEKLQPHKTAAIAAAADKPKKDKNRLHPGGDESSSGSNSNITSDNTDTNDSEEKDSGSPKTSTP